MKQQNDLRAISVHIYVRTVITVCHNIKFIFACLINILVHDDRVQTIL